ncbi:RlpA-like double-psi beta-barrel domain-containing protein [Flammeovirga sp. EKP202]|uniref:RlpA-like double-psi beta-barrel domain-containing protein n=1 Tax=Flammeovirga sp. EKP202 TaxID=2770592 RepID=UPI00165F9702|nr:RlpA-like double-psi beta-barrel domain-containing protein [Flammeovirga sp. EKP202]MBD0402993.1 SPOR domain-containing protein [Flammeovirga sp. EKP202]
MKRKLLLSFVFFLVIQHFSFSQTINKIGYKEMGKASYYPDDRDGIITRGGVKFSKDSMYVAHKYFPFGSIIKVRNIDNGKTVYLKVVDRPYTSSRIIDMTYEAAQRLDIIGQSESMVEVILKDTPATLKEKKKLQQTLQANAVKENNSIDIDKNLFKEVGTYSLYGEKSLEGVGIQFATSPDLEHIISEGKKIESDYLISSVFVQTGWSNGQKVYRLLIGSFSSTEAAQPLLQLLKKGGYSDCFIKKHHNN